MPEVTDADMAVIEHEIGEIDLGSFWKHYLPLPLPLFSTHPLPKPSLTPHP